MSLIRYRRNGGFPVTRHQAWPWRSMDLFADDFFERFFADAGLRADNAVICPAVDVTEEDGSYKLVAELPGVSAEDVSVEVHDGVLELKGERKAESEEEQGTAYVRERSFGSFRRSFRLPRTVDADGIEAALKDGVLTVTVPKAEQVQPRQIEVHA